MPREERDGTPAFWELNPTQRFSDRAADYVRFRPSYPAAAVDALLDGLGDPAGLSAADVGAGTGISSRLLAERGVAVVSIEPNRAMREAALPHPRVVVSDGTAERTPLPDARMDLVLCAQSFHWFEPQGALREFLRILRPGGRLGLLWNVRSLDDPLTAAYSELARRSASDATTDARDDLLESRLTAAGFSAPVERQFENEQELTADGLVGRAASASYVPRGAAFDELALRLRELHARFADAAGLVRLVYRTHLYLAHRPGG